MTAEAAELTASQRCSETLRDAPALSVPVDRPRPDVLAPDVATFDVPVDASVVAGLRRIAAAAGTSLSSVLLAGWSALLHRTTDEQDIVVGCAGLPVPSDGADLLILRQRVSPALAFSDLVEQTGAAVSAAAATGAVSLPDVLRALGLQPGPARHPVFSVAFAALEDAQGAPRPGTEHWPAPPDIALSFWDDGQDVVLRFAYAAQLFDPERVRRTGGHLTTLLHAASSGPERPVGSLPLLTPQEHDELRRFNATRVERPPSGGLAARVAAQAVRTPQACAVEHGPGSLTYDELVSRSSALAHRLRQDGVGPDTTVAVCAERSLDMVVAVLAALWAGAAYVPVDPAYPAARRAWMLQDADAQVVLAHSSLVGELAGASGKVVLLDEVAGETAARPGPVGAPSGEGDLAYVLYTSGSTGQPKGVALPQSALDNLLDWQLDRPQFRPGARTLQFSSLSFDVSFQEIFSTWASGGTLVLVDDAKRRDPLSLLGILLSERVERLFLPYVALQALAAAVASTGRLPHHLREIYTAGEQLQSDPALRAMLDALPDCVLENQYGPTETHVITAHTMPRDTAAWPALPPIGRPIDNNQAHVLDAQRRVRPVGIPGELYLGGAGLARGYLGRPELTAERFVQASPVGGPEERLYRTGDLARWLPDGTLEFLGRTDHQVKFRGYRIEPGEVGVTLSGCPGVRQCVAAVRTTGSGARLTAYLLPDGPAGVDLAAVHAYAKDHLPSHMVPSHYAVLEAFPLTASGKVDLKALPDADFDRGILSSAFREPQTSDEAALVAIWQRVLDLPEVGVHDDFFELGGDSLAGAEMVALISQQLGVELPLGALAQAPTVAGLAGVLRQAPGAVWRSLVPLQTRGDRTPLFVVHGGSGNVATFPRLARGIPADQPVYALQWNGLDGSHGHRTVEAMAQHYLDEVRSVQPHGPYLLAGQCIGGLIARVMTRHLLDSGERVELLVMYDSPHLGSEAYVPPPRRTPSALAADRQLLRNTVLDAMRYVYRKFPTSDPVRRGGRAMTVAARHHLPVELPDTVPTHYFGSGEHDARKLGLDGTWTDGAMGWASHGGPHFVLHRIEGGHDAIMYEPAALGLLADAVAQAQQRIRTSSA